MSGGVGWGGMTALLINIETHTVESIEQVPHPPRLKIPLLLLP
jgi:hypothetical protein